MATQVAGGIVSSNSANSLSISGIAWQQGDLVVAMPGHDAPSALSPAGGAGDGWTEAEAVIAASNHATSILFQVLGASPPSSFTIESAGSAQNMAIGYEVWRPDAGETFAGSSWDSTSVSGTTGAGDVTPSMASVGPASLLFSPFSHDSSSTVATPPSGMTATDTSYSGTAFALATFHQENPTDDPITRTIGWTVTGDTHIAAQLQVSVETSGGGGSPVDIEVPAASLALTPYAPTAAVTAHVDVTIPAASLGLTGYAPTVETTADVDITVPAAALSLTAFAPTVTATAHQTIVVPVASLSLTGHAPSVSTGAHVEIEVPAASLSLTGFAPDVAVTAHVAVEVPAASIALSGYAPTVSLGPLSIAIPVGTLTLTGYPPSVDTGDSEAWATTAATVAYWRTSGATVARWRTTPGTVPYWQTTASTEG